MNKHATRCDLALAHSCIWLYFMPMPNIPLSAADASEQTGIPKRTIQAAIARGDLKARKLGSSPTGAYLIDQRDLDRWIAKREAKASA